MYIRFSTKVLKILVGSVLLVILFDRHILRPFRQFNHTSFSTTINITNRNDTLTTTKTATITAAITTTTRTTTSSNESIVNNVSKTTEEDVTTSSQTELASTTSTTGDKDNVVDDGNEDDDEYGDGDGFDSTIDSENQENENASQQTSQALADFFVQNLLAGEKIVIYQRFDGTGFGSFMLSSLLLAYYYRQKDPPRLFVFDDSKAPHYRLSDETGISGYLDFKNFPVIRNNHDYDVILSELNQTSGLQYLTNTSTWFDQRQNPNYPILRVSEFPKEYGLFARMRYNAQVMLTKDPAGYFKLASLLCFSASFNSYTLGEIHQKLNENSIPDFAKSSWSGIDGSGPEIQGSLGTTVAFHVRRGDKVRRESKSFDEELYVQKLLNISGVVPDQIQHCYVATDDYNVTNGIQESLNRHNIRCQLHFLVLDEGKPKRLAHYLALRKDPQNHILFFTELYMLTHATYFIGSFNSNVGSIASLFRKCSWKGNMGTKMDDFHHFYQSYGVDQDKWFIF
jgi:hypothetical protein